MFLAGPAGTAKTYMAVYSALQAVMTSGLEKDVLYVRSIAESSQRGLGSLPGSIDEKFAVFAGPFYDKLDEMLSTSDIKLLREKKMFECMPVNFVRGANWNDRVVIIDEAQNFTYNELMTVLTRIGEDSKIIICGDMMQSDIRDRVKAKRYSLYKIWCGRHKKKRDIKIYSFKVRRLKIKFKNSYFILL